MSSSFRVLDQLINELVHSGAVEQRQTRALRKSVKELRHARSVRDTKRFHKAFDKVCRQLNEIFRNHG